MSWSFTGVGRAKPLSAKIKDDLSKMKCSEPEESIKNKVAEALVLAVGSFPGLATVSVTASGSQYVPDSSKPNEAINSLQIKVEQLWNFVE